MMSDGFRLRVQGLVCGSIAILRLGFRMLAA